MIWAGEYVFGSAWAAFRGSAADNGLHSHATLQLVLAPDRPAVLRQPNGEAVAGTALLVRSGLRHALDPIAAVVLVFLEPQTELASHVDRACMPGAIAPLPPTIANRIDTSGGLAQCLSRLEADIRPPPEPLDPRLEAALRFLEAEDGPRALARAAAHAGLSTARLRALARGRLGTPLATWRAWRRLERAGMAMARGASLAEAAAEAGFADQAHLTRATRQVFGITPGVASGVMRTDQAKRSRPAMREPL